MDQYAIVLFDPTSPFVDQIRLDERRIEIGPIQLSLKQQYEEDGKGGTEIGFGASVYPSSISLSEFLISCPDLVEGKRIVEIGFLHLSFSKNHLIHRYFNQDVDLA